MSKNKLIKLQEEYIKLLEDELSKLMPFMAAHRYKAKEEDIKRGEELRRKIKFCKKAIDKK